MTNNIDDILDSVGLESVRSRRAAITNNPPSEPVSVSTVQTVEEPIGELVSVDTPESASLSEDDFMNILQDNGFPVQDTAETVSDLEEEFDELLDAEEEIVEEEAAPQLESDWVDDAIQTLDSLQEALNEANDSVDSISDVSSVTTNELIIHGPEEPQQEEAPEDTARIPENSPTLLLNDAVSRFSGTEWFKEIRNAKIILAGMGGIGSNVAFQLARMAPASMVLYDDDRVEIANMSGQLYSINDAGHPKVDAISSMIQKYTTANNIYAINTKFTESSEAGDIMICGFDSMTARKTFFRSWIAHIENKTKEEKKKCVFIDGRLSIDTLQVFCIAGDDEFNARRYMNDFLFSDAEADATVCSMKQTTYLACMIGSIMVNLFTNFIAGTLNPIIPYDLPFFTEYDAQHMIFKTEN